MSKAHQAPDRLSRASGRVERMYGGVKRDYLIAIGALIDNGTDLEIVAQVALCLRDRLLLAERAQHDDHGVGMSGAEQWIGQQSGLDVVDLGPDRNPTQAA